MRREHRSRTIELFAGLPAPSSASSASLSSANAVVAPASSRTVAMSAYQPRGRMAALSRMVVTSRTPSSPTIMPTCASSELRSAADSTAIEPTATTITRIGASGEDREERERRGSAAAAGLRPLAPASRA